VRGVLLSVRLVERLKDSASRNGFSRISQEGGGREDLIDWRKTAKDSTKSEKP